MRALLVYPDFPVTFWSFKYALEFIHKKASFPPLGLLTVAAMLPGKWEKKLVDMNVRSLRDSDLEWADCVFISAMSIQRTSTMRVIERCRKKGVRTVAGGPLFTTSPDDFADIDHLVLNEAELTMPAFLKDLEEGNPKRIYSAEGFADLAATPVPAWELINMRKYASMNIQYSRGCPFNCEFCDIVNLLGRVPRLKSCEQVIAELDALYDAGWRSSVFFVDDNFIGNKVMLKKHVLPAIIEWMDRKGHPFVFFTEASIDLSDDEELMRMMVSAGFETVFVGIESPNRESLAECSKFQNQGRDLLESVKKSHNYGLQVQGGFIVGFDSDPQSIFQNLIDFIQESGIVTAMVGLLNAPKGTRLYQRMVKEGRLLKNMSGDNTDFSMNFIPKMNYETLQKGYRSILNSIYSPKHYYSRVMKFFKDYRPLRRKSFRIDFSQISALFRSMFFLGVVGSERKYYWRLFFWSLFKRPRLFPMAITFAIYGFHFRKVFR